MSMPVDRIIEQSLAVENNLQISDDETLADSGFYWRERGGVRVLVCRELQANGFTNGFSTRLGGVSPFPDGDLNLAGFDEDVADNIMENRRRFLNVVGDSFQLATAWQVHGDTLKKIRSEEDIGGSEDRADAIASDLAGVLAGVKTADCVPILIGDPVTGAFAAVHAGWRGTAKSIVAKAVAELKTSYGAFPEHLVCAIGPAACGKNYEIGQDVIDEFAANIPGSEKYFTPTRDGHALVDLHRANRDQLIDAGARDQNLFTAPFCTMEWPDLFFSYRLEKRTLGKTGRLLSVIGREAT
ncbi:MAG: peptidoglycan editing factor PgeF [Pyrinomonadaceae bacterium]